MYEPTAVLKSEKGRYRVLFKSRAGRDLRFHVQAENLLAEGHLPSICSHSPTSRY